MQFKLHDTLRAKFRNKQTGRTFFDSFVVIYCISNRLIIIGMHAKGIVVQIYSSQFPF